MGDIKPVASLSDEINAATRSLHTTLNRLITSRLPLALPPHATDPTLYTTGILHFSYVFLTFESLWADLIAPSSAAAPSSPSSPLLSFLLVNPYDSPELFSEVTPATSEMLLFLQNVRPKGLARSNRLKRDLEYLTSMKETDLSVLLSKYPEDRVAEYCTHIRDAVRRNPHVLIAYAWCFYMAVFSGGRWIRAQLMNVGEEFWHSIREGGALVPLEEKGLSLWHFEGDSDGEDIKAEFKRRLADAEALFSADQRADIIEEARTIFKFSALLVEELDQKLATDTDALDRAHQPGQTKALETRGLVERPPQNETPLPVGWSVKPGLTGAIFALGCLAGVAWLKFVPSAA